MDLSLVVLLEKRCKLANKGHLPDIPTHIVQIVCHTILVKMITCEIRLLIQKPFRKKEI